jgi:hypothetical protein
MMSPDLDNLTIVQVAQFFRLECDAVRGADSEGEQRPHRVARDRAWAMLWAHAMVEAWTEVTDYEREVCDRGHLAGRWLEEHLGL